MTDAGEKAMALVDGQLAPAEVPRLVERLARDPALVAELQQYLTVSQSRLAGAYAAWASEPVPARLIEAVTGTVGGTAGGPVADTAEDSGGDTVRGAPRPGKQPRAHRMPVGGRLRGWLLGWLRVRCRVPAWSLAAVPAGAALAAFGVSLMVLPLDRGGPIKVDLTAALETTASGRETALATLRPVLSFASREGGWCRQFEMRGAGRQVSHALACRGDGGDWDIVASTPPASAGYRPAGAGRRKRIDDLATSMMRSRPLSEADEAAAIARGWRRL